METWEVLFDPEFELEFESFSITVQDEIYANLVALQELGPMMGRPRVDTLNGSEYSRMKELRFAADGGIWRLLFAFDPARQAILLVAGDKRGKNQSKFYKRLISIADSRFKKHLLKQE